MYHEKIDHLLDTYARKLAENMNQGFAIDARVPSVMIAGPANFPVGKKEKQNRARDSNMEEWRYIQGLLDKIRSTGMGGISTDDPAAIEKLQKKLDGLERSQLIMKEVNAYYRKHGKLDGCALLSPDQIEKLKASITYRQNGDYLIPNIIIRKTKPLGHYGRLRKAYLEMHRPILFNELVLSDKLFEHCAEIDEAARNRMELIVRSLAKQYGVTEQLKAENQMEWVRQMNACKAQAEEIVKAELIYD